jgi:DNA-directed RNA polymerase specialized sigma subunit
MDRQPRLSLALVRRTNRHREFPLDALRAIVEARRCLAEVERESIELARQAGATWEEIASALGVSRQAIYQRHRR